MPGEIVGTELGSRVHAVADQVNRPLSELSVVAADEFTAVAEFEQSSGQKQHVAAFFDRHLRFRVAVVLAVGQRISAEIMRGEITFPAPRFEKLKYRDQHGFEQLRRDEQKQRRRRISHVDRRNAAVGMVLL